jgi:hypothetical protein
VVKEAATKTKETPCKGNIKMNTDDIMMYRDNRPRHSRVDLKWMEAQTLASSIPAVSEQTSNRRLRRYLPLHYDWPSSCSSWLNNLCSFVLIRG